MKKMVVWTAAMAVAGALSATTADETYRAVVARNVGKISADGGWRFRLDGGKWQTVDLPHDWSIAFMPSLENGTDKYNAFLPGGVGEYEKDFTLDEPMDLVFEGAFRDVKLFVDGELRATDFYGYLPFSASLKKGLNRVRVVVDNSAQPNSGNYTGSGINRRAWLVKPGADKAPKPAVRMPKVTWSAAKGLQIDGKTVKLHGGCVHADNGGLGTACWEEADVRKVRQLKAAGFNAIRQGHHAFSEAFLDACDAEGLWVLADYFDVWRDPKQAHDYSTRFDANWEKDLRAKTYVWYDPTVKGEPIKPALYNFDSVAYESLMVAVATVWQGPENFMYDRVGLPKPSDLHLAFSRNGFDYSRPDDRTPFLACSRRKGDWNAGYLHSNAGVCLVNGDELWFYFTGFAGDPKRLKRTSSLLEDVGTYANASMGLARLRRDGFCSMDADGDATLVTRPLVFREGDRLFVNANVRGCLAAEILDEDGRTLDGFALADAKPLHGDSCKAELAWKGGFLSFGANRSLASLRGRPVRIRFKARDAELYSFWFSDETGRSRGYLGGGSPDHATLKDE